MTQQREFKQGIATAVEYLGMRVDVTPNEPFSLSQYGLFLAPPAHTDIEAITAACQDPEIQRWTTVPYPYGLPDAEHFVEEICPKLWADGSPTWAIHANLDADERQLVGVVGLTRKNADTAEIGYWLAPEARGKRLMSRAVSMVLDAAFSKLGFTAVLWFAEVGNWASWRTAWRLGFKPGGVIPAYATNKGVRADYWSASITADSARVPTAPWNGPGTEGLDGAKGLPAVDPGNPEALVRQFHHVYGLPIVLSGANADFERVHMRMNLILEEVTELVAAVYGEEAGKRIEEAARQVQDLDEYSRDTIETADALADLVYVIYGMALESGISLPAVLAEVQASNLSKLDSQGKPIYREDGKVLKGENFFEPNVARALRNRLTP
ncbi:MAG: GNAT family N-acetyltransferase [Actinomycetaceae bacterium]|nr:GNAT family N-acetyltransferase [Actinomycetaceae bacterium]